MMELFAKLGPVARRLGFWMCLAGSAQAQLSSLAYRVLGQPDLNQRGTNVVQAASLASPGGLALDSRDGVLHLYISDTSNSRVLAWKDAKSYQTGDAPDLILGQPNATGSAPLGIGNGGFSVPVGLAVNPATGDLYVADFGDNRILRFPNPFANPGRVEPDSVYGQPDLNTRTAGTSSGSLTAPRGLAFDAQGNLWVTDTGNNRILRFAASNLNNPVPQPADTVIGQKDFVSKNPNAGANVSGAGLDFPWGLAIDAQNNLYVADVNNSRVLKFAAPLATGTSFPSAAAVYGQPDFVTRSAGGTPNASTLRGPAGVALDSAGRVYVATPADNRVLIFPPTGGAALNVLGQPDFVTTVTNSQSFPLASPNSLCSPFDLKVDSDGNVYVADSGNNRVVKYPPNSKSAVQIWGQSDFSSTGTNQIKPSGLNAPNKAVIDYSQAPFALYISDAANNRVLVWKDSVKFRNGDAADLVIGQPDLRTGAVNVDTQGSVSPSSTSLSGPLGLAVDKAGNLWVVDNGNNRVLRYPRPVAQSGRITPDVVLGQGNFNSSVSAVVSASSLRAPAAVTVGPDGDIFVADSGNNRILEYASNASTGVAALRVYGQANFLSGTAPTVPSAQTLASPHGLYVDAAFNLYVADTATNRVVIFPNTQVAPQSGTPAAFVIGQDAFNAVSGGTGTTLSLPTDVALDSSGNIYVSDTGNNRVLRFPSLLFLKVAGDTATAVVGQKDLTSNKANWDSTNGLATADGLFAPLGIYLDRRDTLYVGDAGNNRVLHFLKPAAVLNVAHYLAGVPVGQGGLAALFGAGLADKQEGPVAPPFSTTMQNRQILINDTIPAPVFAVSPGQMNFQVPGLAPVGTDRIVVRFADTGELVAGGTVLVAAVSPGLFTLSQDGKGQAAALNKDGRTVNGSANPAARGEVISLFATGQGQVSPGIPDGMPATGTPQTVAVPTSDGQTCLTTQPSMCVAIGSSFGTVQYSGLAPNYVGLWQINVQIPQDALTGNVPVRVVIDGTPSNTVTIAIR